jgi:hypothetical protein
MSAIIQPRSARPVSRTLSQAGYWSAILTTLWSVAFTLAFAWQAVIAPQPGSGAGIEAYAASFSSLRMAMVLVPSLLLAPSFVALIACIHGGAPEGKRVWSRIGLGLAIIYATIATINYTIQLIVVRGSLLAGETDGLSLLIMDNRHSLFWGLAIVGYNVYQALAALLIVPTLGEGRLERWIGRLFTINAVVCVFAAVDYFVTLNGMHWVGLVASAVWCIAFPAATTILAVRFRRMA